MSENKENKDITQESKSASKRKKKNIAVLVIMFLKTIHLWAASTL